MYRYSLINIFITQFRFHNKVLFRPIYILRKDQSYFKTNIIEDVKKRIWQT